MTCLILLFGDALDLSRSRPYPTPTHSLNIACQEWLCFHLSPDKNGRALSNSQGGIIMKRKQQLNALVLADPLSCRSRN